MFKIIDILRYVFSGGFMKGYRSYVLGGGLLITAILNFLVGDVSLVDVVQVLANVLVDVGQQPAADVVDKVHTLLLQITSGLGILAAANHDK